MGGGGVVRILRGRGLKDCRPSHAYDAWAEHVGYSPTRQELFAPSAKRREVFGESHAGWAASYQEPLVKRISRGGGGTHRHGQRLGRREGARGEAQSLFRVVSNLKKKTWRNLTKRA